MGPRKPSEIVLDSVGKGSVDLKEVASQITYLEKLASRLSPAPSAKKPSKEKVAGKVLPRNKNSVEKITDLVDQLKSLGGC